MVFTLMTDVLDSAKILEFVASGHRSQLAQLDIFPTLPSTNTYLLNFSKKKQLSGHVCLAEEQTQGRGRQGKQWYSPKGKNIYFSLSWNFPLPITDISHLSLAVGVMIAKALQRFGIASGIQLKWPNDIYYANRKLAGVLIEAIPSSQNYYPVVIGIGLNVCIGGYDQQTAIGLAEIKANSVSRNQVIGLILDELVANIPLYINDGFANFFNDYCKYDMLRGKYVVIRTGKFEIVGMVEGINAAGELHLRDQNGMAHFFRCGEVSVVLDTNI